MGERLENLALRKTLWWKLVLLLLLVSIIGGIIHFFAFWVLYDKFDDFVEQRALWSIATEIEHDIRDMLDPKFDKERLIAYLGNLERIEKKLEVYLVDRKKGRVIFSLYYLGETPQRNITPAIEKFLSVVGQPDYPIYGPDPRSSQMKVFSAAETAIEGRPAYVYVILRGAYYRVVYHMTGDYSAVLGSGAFFIGVMVFVCLFGFAISLLFTRRFQRITRVIGEFARGNYQSRIPVDSDDEIAILASTFNKMADTIQDNIRVLAEKDRSRREMVANISHDLRTPISVMQGLLESLQTMFFKMDQSQREDFLQTAIANCRELNSRIEELFELSRLNSATEMIECSDFPLDELFMETISRFNGSARQAQIQLKLDVSEDLPLVNADQKLIGRALNNIIENALRYSGPDSKVMISAHPNDGKVEVAISDTGVGIAADDLPHVFDRFYRGRSSEEKSSKGSGLGLAITKRIIELHQSEITVQSRVGEGTTFRFSLRAAKD